MNHESWDVLDAGSPLLVPSGWSESKFKPLPVGFEDVQPNAVFYERNGSGFFAILMDVIEVEATIPPPKSNYSHVLAGLVPLVRVPRLAARLWVHILQPNGGWAWRELTAVPHDQSGKTNPSSSLHGKRTFLLLGDDGKPTPWDPETHPAMCRELAQQLKASRTPPPRKAPLTLDASTMQAVPAMPILSQPA